MHPLFERTALESVYSRRTIGEVAEGVGVLFRSLFFLILSFFIPSFFFSFRIVQNAGHPAQYGLPFHVLEPS